MPDGALSLTSDRAVTAASRRRTPSLAEARSRPGYVLLVVLLVGATFAVDLLLPLGIAGGIPYVAPVLVTMWLPARRVMLPTALVCSVLIGAGWLLSPPGAPFWAVLPNRALAILAVWTVALLAFQRRRIESSLAEAEATTRAVLATTADGILTLGADGQILSANPAAARIFGAPEADLAGQPLGQCLGPADRAAFEQDPAAYLDALAAPPAAAHEAVGRHASGTTFPVELALVLLAVPAGTRYTLTVRDITERRLLEQHLLRSSEEERRAVGHGLHEELGQTLTGLNLISRQLARRLEHLHADEAREAADLAAMLHDADALALRLFETLVPIDAKGGLAEALDQLVRDLARRYGVRCRIEQAGGLPPTEALPAAQLYRIVQDLLHGALPGGRVHEVVLVMGPPDAALVVRLRGDDVAGADGWDDLIRALTYRAQLIGARLQVVPSGRDDLGVACTW